MSAANRKKDKADSSRNNKNKSENTSISSRSDRPAPIAKDIPEQSTLLSSLFNSIFKIALVFWIVQFAKNTVSPHLGSSAKESDSLNPLWQLGTSLDLLIFYSEQPQFNTQSSVLAFEERNISYGNYSDVRLKSIEIPVTRHLLSNGSLYAHILVAKTELKMNPAAGNVPEQVNYVRASLIKFFPKFAGNEKKKLLDSSSNVKSTQLETPTAQNVLAPIISHWWPNLTINIIDSGPLPPSLNPLIMNHVRMAPEDKRFYPITWYNDFWMLREQLTPINATLKHLNLSINFEHMPLWKFQFLTQFSESFRVQNDMFGVSSSETDNIKSMFSDTNPILLVVTFLVSLLHSVFDFLAFKNDIQFWRKRKDTEGLSLRAIVLNIVFQCIIFLYLLDNETSWVVISSSGIGLAIEFWKVLRVINVEFDFKSIQCIKFIDKAPPSKKLSETQRHDEVAFTYLSYLFYPLLFGYAVYSLYFEEHKSWYSFIVSTLVGFVYMFGFITMTPQLYINYKLKSVAHMPWKTFMYKALNTFIDDLFAFVVKMPWLHRIACLRDDVVFLIYLYQKWIYVEDKTRANEFGQTGVSENDHVVAKTAVVEENAIEEKKTQ